MASCPAHLVLGSLVLVQLSLQNLLCELHLRFPLILLLLGLVEWTMSLGTGIGLLHSILLPEHHRVPELEPLQKTAVCVLHVGQESKKTPSNLVRIWPRTERVSPSQLKNQRGLQRKEPSPGRQRRAYLPRQTSSTWHVIPMPQEMLLRFPPGISLGQPRNAASLPGSATIP